MIFYTVLFGKVKMLRSIFICSLLVNLISANSPESKNDTKSAASKPLAVDELKAPNVLKTKTQFRFKEIIVSFLNNKKLSYLVFDLVLDRDSTAPSEPQEEDVPLIIDTLLSDLFPTINLFGSGKNDRLQESLQLRIDRILKAKFNWITAVKVLNTRIQGSGNE
ncbi:MAG: hypothetical protein Q8Q56_01920 [Alphaproteobacteria bacterium]|nr:hypothetical protein [Alphaproteobacteria bacterium]